ncbi:MAG: glycerate kinase, partial [Frankiales bacterium]|nr:glycerate kinase [Frankiales bacterium]
MRILIAPDGFGGTLSAVQAAEAMAAGWRQTAPGDTVELAPLSDGGPGFVDVLAAALATSTLLAVGVQDPRGSTVPASLLLDGATAYVESAQACGLHLLVERDPTTTTTYGVGQLVRAATDAGATRIVVGLGGSATNDGGAGMLAALGLTALDAVGAALAPGGLALRRADRLVGGVAPVELVAATDVDAPLLGLYGASAVF